jgi:ribosomal protein S18 acetylase RimI-like enzyme
MIFNKEDWFFELTSPDYETPIFGGKLGELRSIGADKVYNSDFLLTEDLCGYLWDNDYLACTFRGAEDIKLIRYLNDIGFLFVGTYGVIHCSSSDFTPLKVRDDLVMAKASEMDYDEMTGIQSRVFDYSTHQLDFLLDSTSTSNRNVLRLKSYFSNPNHIAYIIRNDEGVLLGYMQGVIDGGTVHLTNAAINPDYHGQRVGSTLYSKSFDSLFKSGIDLLTSGYSNQNIPVFKIHRSCGFRVYSHEIHLRIHNPNSIDR